MPNFSSVSQLHSHDTRGSGFNYRLSIDLSLSPDSFAYTAIKVWNSLPDDLKGISELRVFKRKLKDYFLSRYDWPFWPTYGLTLLTYGYCYLFTFHFVLIIVTDFTICHGDPVGNKSWGLLQAILRPKLVQFVKLYSRFVIENKFIHSFIMHTYSTKRVNYLKFFGVGSSRNFFSSLQIAMGRILHFLYCKLIVQLYVQV